MVEKTNDPLTRRSRCSSGFSSTCRRFANWKILFAALVGVLLVAASIPSPTFAEDRNFSTIGEMDDDGENLVNLWDVQPCIHMQDGSGSPFATECKEVAGDSMIVCGASAVPTLPSNAGIDVSAMGGNCHGDDCICFEDAPAFC